MADQNRKKKLTWTFYHFTVFILTFMCYAFFHATRKTFSNVKETISEEWTPSFHNESVQELKPDNVWNKHCLFDNKKSATLYLGALDTAFMISYAVGLYISGFVGDRLNMRLVLTFGMCSAAVMVFIFGTVSEWLGIYNVVFYMAFWILNGLLQSTGWPTVVAVMGNWFGKSSRGFVLGLWSACASVGNIIGSELAGVVVGYGYEYAFLITSSMLFGGGVVIFFGLVTSPREVGLPEPDEDEDTVEEDQVHKPLLEHTQEVDEVSEDSEETAKTQERPEAISFKKALLLPGVIPYSLAYACLKTVNYAFFFWLPFYLSTKFKWTQSKADEISVWYDVGGIIGGIIGGFITDRMKNRAPVVTLMLILAIPSLFVYSNAPGEIGWNSFFMGLAGFFIGGPANLISAAISADLGRQGPIQGNKEALATVTGIIDGTGSVGAAIGQELVAVIETQLGWKWVFYFFILMTILTVVCIVPMLIKEIRAMACFQRFTRRSVTVVYPPSQHIQTPVYD